MKDEYAAYKVHQITNLILAKEGKRFLMVYLSFKKKLADNQDLIGTLEKAIEDLKIN
jgi:hypothetical protein